MSNVNASPKYVHKGPNNNNDFWVEIDDLATALASSDTLTVTLPAGVDPAAIPVAVIFYTVSAGVWTVGAVASLPLAAATHTVATGVTVFTAGGTVAQHAKIAIRYMALT